MKIFIVLLLLISTHVLAHNGTPYLIEVSVNKNHVSITLPRIIKPLVTSVTNLCKPTVISSLNVKAHCEKGVIQALTINVPGRLPKQQVLVKIDNHLLPLSVINEQHVIFDLSRKNNAFDFLTSGFNHLINGWDHIVLLILIAFNYTRLKDLFLIITSFSIGHGAIILAISALQFRVDSSAIELLIALSILLYAREILLKNQNSSNKVTNLFAAQNIFWLCIGVIHGAGLASNLIENNELTFAQIFAFTIGIDAAQFIVIMIFLIFTLSAKYLFHYKSENIKVVFCYACIVLSTIKTVELFV
jgi:hypothetical protein